LGSTAGFAPRARVLLVEDNEINQIIACEFLGEFGMDVDVAGDGRAGIEQLHCAHYDLVLMDMQMPVMGGLEATREIRRDAQWASLPVVAMTASAMERDRTACLDAGMNDFVSKPFEPEELRAVLARWLDQGRRK
jgi:two-component system sensor histidine kinase/response regulator